MKTKKYLILIIASFLIILIGVLIYIKSTYPSPVEGSCEKIIDNNGKINIVFFTENVDKEKAKEYAEYLLNSEPFSLYKEAFNFYYAGNADCEMYKENILYCYSKELIKKSSVCKNDYIIVLSEKSRDIRSSSYINVLSINVNHQNSVLLHEFGHVFANLADEYVPSEIPFRSKNCQNKCESFNAEEIDACYGGCCKSDYYRSSESSVMRTLSTNEYKKLNTLIIKKLLDKYEKI